MGGEVEKGGGGRGREWEESEGGVRSGEGEERK